MFALIRNFLIQIILYIFSQTCCYCMVFSPNNTVARHHNCLCVLQTQGPGSPRSSPGHTINRPIPTPIHSDSAGTTPTHTPQDSLMGVGGDVQEAFAQGNTLEHMSMHLAMLEVVRNHASILPLLVCLFWRSKEKSEKWPAHCCGLHHQHDVVTGQGTQFG